MILKWKEMVEVLNVGTEVYACEYVNSGNGKVSAVKEPVIGKVLGKSLMAKDDAYIAWFVPYIKGTTDLDVNNKIHYYDAVYATSYDDAYSIYSSINEYYSDGIEESKGSEETKNNIVETVDSELNCLLDGLLGKQQNNSLDAVLKEDVTEKSKEEHDTVPEKKITKRVAKSSESFESSESSESSECKKSDEVKKDKAYKYTGKLDVEATIREIRKTYLDRGKYMGHSKYLWRALELRNEGLSNSDIAKALSKEFNSNVTKQRVNDIFISYSIEPNRVPKVSNNIILSEELFNEVDMINLKTGRVPSNILLEDYDGKIGDTVIKSKVELSHIWKRSYEVYFGK